jgi:formylglycine-generating enzyme required for sulfatase activity
MKMGWVLVALGLWATTQFPSLGKTTNNLFQPLEPAAELLVGGASRPRARELELPPTFVFVPGGDVRLGSPEGGAESPLRVAKISGFWIARHETTRAEYAEFLNATGATNALTDFVRRGTTWRTRWFESRLPMAGVTLGEAQNYCVWLGAKLGCCARLPSEDEWECAARGGIIGARFPWGWGDPAGRACFAANAPQRVERFEPNPFGLYDMAGNVFEWCAPTNAAAEKIVARGGSWAERDPRQLRVFQRAWFRRDYRGADVGFRVLIKNEEVGR